MACLLNFIICSVEKLENWKTFNTDQKKMVPIYIYNARSVDHLWQRDVVGTVGVGKGNACVRLNLRKNHTWQLFFAECREGWRLLYSSKSTFHRYIYSWLPAGILRIWGGWRGLNHKSPGCYAVGLQRRTHL